MIIDHDIKARFDLSRRFYCDTNISHVCIIALSLNDQISHSRLFQDLFPITFWNKSMTDIVPILLGRQPVMKAPIQPHRNHWRMAQEIKDAPGEVTKRLVISLLCRADMKTISSAIYAKPLGTEDSYFWMDDLNFGSISFLRP